MESSRLRGAIRSISTTNGQSIADGNAAMKATDWNRTWEGLGCLVLLSLLGPVTTTAQETGTRETTAPETGVNGLLTQQEIDQQEIRSNFVPEAIDGRFVLPKLDAPSTTVESTPGRRTPQDYREEQVAQVMPLPEVATQRGIPWNWTVVNWAAADTFSNPRYFEDRMLERHGQECRWHLQPLASGSRFFLTVPMLPYLMTVSNPCECEYTLGYYRSGSCSPALKQRPPYERNAMIVEGLVASGLIIGFP